MALDDEPLDLNDLALDELGEADADDAPPPPRRTRRARRPAPALPTEAQVHTPTAAQAGDETGEVLTDEARAIIDRNRGSSLRTTLGIISLTALVAATVFGIRALGAEDPAQAMPSGHPDVSQMTQEEIEAAGSASGSEQMTPSPVDEQAVARLEQAVAEDPADTGAMRSLADLYYAVNDYRNAAQWHQRILTVDPQNTDAMMMLGLSAFNMGDMPLAQGSWERAIATDDTNVEARYNVGFAYLAEGRYDDARAAWEQVEQIAPGTDLAQEAASSISQLEDLRARTEGR